MCSCEVDVLFCMLLHVLSADFGAATCRATSTCHVQTAAALYGLQSFRCGFDNSHVDNECTVDLVRGRLFLSTTGVMWAPMHSVTRRFDLRRTLVMIFAVSLRSWQ
jgi:hypothetical protein